MAYRPKGLWAHWRAMMESHTRRLGVTVHDAFPPFPTKKKKKKTSVLEDNTEIRSVLRFCPYSYPTDTGVLKHLSIHTQRWVPSVRFSSLYHRITREVTGELEALQKAGRGTN